MPLISFNAFRFFWFSCRPTRSSQGVDGYGLKQFVSREVQVRDEPSMVLVGPDPFVLLQGDSFVNPQATRRTI